MVGAGLVLARPAPTVHRQVTVAIAAPAARHVPSPPRSTTTTISPEVARDRAQKAGMDAAASIVRYVGADWTRRHPAPVRRYSVTPRPTWATQTGMLAQNGTWYCPQWSGITIAIWGAHAHWADRVMGGHDHGQPNGESGCRIDAWGGGAFGLMQLQGHAVAYEQAAAVFTAAGVPRPCAIGYADAWCEIQAGYQWCQIQPGAWSFHGSCHGY